MNLFNKIIVLALMLVLASTLSSAFVFRDVEKEQAAEWQRYQDYRSGYGEFYGLKGYEKYFNEYQLASNFGFRPASYYYPTRDVWNARYNPPLQGEAYSTSNRPYASSLAQPNAVQYYADKTGGRYSGYIQPDLNGVYFDHPSARQTYGYITLGGYNPTPYGGYGYGGGYGGYYAEGGNAFYARVASQVSDDAYVVQYY